MEHIGLKGWLTAAVVLLSASIFWIPSVIVSRLPTVTIGYPVSEYLQETVAASGTLRYPSHRELYLGLPVIVEDVLVQAGERVEAGQTLLTVDIEATRQALAVQTAFGNLFDIRKEEIVGWEALQTVGGWEAADLEQLLDRYAVSASDWMEAGSASVLSDLLEMEREVRSPVDGVVTEVSALPQSPAAAYSPLLTVVPNDSLSAQLQVSEMAAGQIQTGQRVTLRGEGFDGEMEGWVAEIAPVATQVLTGSTLTRETVVEVAVTIEQPLAAAKEGYTVSASIETGPSERVWLVPYEAVAQDEENREYVMVYEGGYARKRILTTGGDLYQGVVVREGIDRDTPLILHPEGLEEGTRVRLTAEGGAG